MKGQDSAERQQIEQQLERSLSLLQATLDSTADGILVVDRQGRIVSFNRRFVELWCIPEQILRSSDDSIAFVLERLMETEGSLEKLRELGDDIDAEGEGSFEFTDGRVFEWYSLPQRLNATVIGRVWSFRDVTKQRQMQRQLLLAERLSSMGMLAAGVAHEINNPLTYVITNLGHLAEQLPERLVQGSTEQFDDLLELLAESREGTERIRRIVQDLKTLSRSDDEERVLHDLQRILEFSVNVCWSQIKHRARLATEYAKVPPVIAAKGKLGQVFLNLLINAAQSITEGDPENNQIRIATFTDSSNVIVEISDTGCGIAPETLARIFEPFFTTKPIGIGTGLGLSVCRGIVQALGGDILVQSELGKGSVFRVVLPAARVEAAEPVSSTLRKPQARRCRVLFIDDEPAVGKSVQRILHAKHDLVVCNSGREALDLLRSDQAFDVIFCDLMMPGLTGMDVYAEMLRFMPEQALRTVFITGGTFTSRAKEFLKDCSNLRLEKPFEADSLLAVIQQARERELANKRPSCSG